MRNSRKSFGADCSLGIIGDDDAMFGGGGDFGAAAGIIVAGAIVEASGKLGKEGKLGWPCNIEGLSS